MHALNWYEIPNYKPCDSDVKLLSKVSFVDLLINSLPGLLRAIDDDRPINAWAACRILSSSATRHLVTGEITVVVREEWRNSTVDETLDQIVVIIVG